MWNRISMTDWKYCGKVLEKKDYGDADIATITAEFAKMPALYIADGHHRSAAAALVGAEKAKQNPNHSGDEEYNYFMAVCFPANQLTIIDYKRVCLLYTSRCV